MAETNGVPVSISGMVLFIRPPYLENLRGIEEYILICTLSLSTEEKVLAKRLLENCIEDRLIKTHH